ncbi:complex I intermediate-associated protein-like protein CIA30, partial [Polychaeton citri CBS 116435]
MPGFWKRSMEEFKRQAGIAIRMEGIHSPTRPRPIINFTSPDVVDRCKLMCDRDIGGFSKASLTFESGNIPPTEQGGNIDAVLGDGQEPNHLLFKGSISTELPPKKPEVMRSGFAAWRTRDRGQSLFGKLLFDLDPYSYLALRVRSDGRKYYVNIQTESIVPTDIHQHLLPCFEPGKWETVIIPLHAFVRTNYGMVVEPQKEMMRQKIRSIGIGSTDRVPGPFELAVAGVWATNKEPNR